MREARGTRDFFGRFIPTTAYKRPRKSLLAEFNPRILRVLVGKSPDQGRRVKLLIEVDLG
jgi:hypothetical protein